MSETLVSSLFCPIAERGAEPQAGVMALERGGVPLVVCRVESQPERAAHTIADARAVLADGIEPRHDDRIRPERQRVRTRRERRCARVVIELLSGDATRHVPGVREPLG